MIRMLYKRLHQWHFRAISRAIKTALAMLQARIYGDNIDNIPAYACTSSYCSRLEALESFIQATRLMSLSFAGVDVKGTADGHYVMLDINPAPMFAGFEQIRDSR